ncbi:MAG TPA: DUF2200 family protein [Cellulomonas sp.]|uniref:DUF2200 family protein n=1 Tax=Cellulomonas sp. TaxID=40001 RepID=UPI002E2F9133|nr:DUF2200 family protein [Cellulomonas sp.]HEX5332197.1 DUF2200 family protein [Cellulomonas sp.]
MSESVEGDEGLAVGSDPPEPLMVARSAVLDPVLVRHRPIVATGGALITGLIRGYRVEEIEDPLMQQIRYMDKLVDELARGRKMTAILRGGAEADVQPAT